MTTARQLDAIARRLATTLQKRQTRIVFAESCTAGLISAVLAKVPGISDYHCGSAVVYRIGTKRQWLGIDADILRKPGPVSKIVAAEMAERVLLKTPEADLAASVTGHLGPGAPKRQDGLIYVGVAHRAQRSDSITSHVVRHRLAGNNSSELSPRQAEQIRVARQRAAAEFVIHEVLVHLNK